MSPHRHPEDTHLTLNSDLRIGHGIKQEVYIRYKKDLLEMEGIRCHLRFVKPKKTHCINGIEVKENGSFYLKT